MITDHRFEAYVHTDDRPLALIQLVLCAQRLPGASGRTSTSGTGVCSGSLEERRFAEIINAGINDASRIRAGPEAPPPKAGKRYLLWRPDP